MQQVIETLSLPVRQASADEPGLRSTDWIAQQWEAARLAIEGENGAVLVLDEIQKIPGWSETVKRLWDEDTRKKCPIGGGERALLAQERISQIVGYIREHFDQKTTLISCESRLLIQIAICLQAR